MELVLGNITINNIDFSAQTEIKDGTLYINRAELIAHVAVDKRLASVEVQLARPGESVRIIPVKDVIEPRVKVDGSGDIFPGLLSGVTQVGTGRTHVLNGAAVVTCGRIVGFQEGLIDMSGPAAGYSPFSQLNNIVLILEPKEGITRHDHEEALRFAGLRAAAYLGQAGKEITPDKTTVYSLTPITTPTNQLPKVVYVKMLLSEGLLHDTYLYGVDVKQILPTFIHPNEGMDGAIVSGNCVSACDKHTTYHHQNDPVVEDLYRRNGKDLNFVGMIISNVNVRLADKERSAEYAAKLVNLLGVDGAVITEEGFGNPDTDLMMLCRKIEQRGVKTVLITDEYAGSDGLSQSLADGTPEATAVVSVGNANMMLELPPMERVIGHLEPVEVIAGGFSGGLKPDGSVAVELQVVMGATCQLGFSTLAARAR
jgi:glycine reductase